MEFERENDIMDQRQEMMDDAIDDAMDTGVEEEGDEVVEQVLEEIGVDLSQSVGSRHSVSLDVTANEIYHQLGETPSGLQTSAVAEGRVAQAQAVGGGGGGDPGDDDLQARLDSLRR